MAFSRAFFGPGTGPIWLDDVECIGDEDSIFDCLSRPPGEHNCGHFEDASVGCSGMYTAVQFYELLLLLSVLVQLGISLVIWRMLMSPVDVKIGGKAGCMIFTSCNLCSCSMPC